MDVSQKNYANKRSQTKQNIYYMIIFEQNSGKCKLVYSDKKQWVVSWDCGVGVEIYKEIPKKFWGLWGVFFLCF